MGRRERGFWRSAIARKTDLPLGVVRVLLGDLHERGLVRVVRAASRSAPEQSVLRSVLDGLRAL
jgi:ribosomal protein S25